MKTQIAWYPSQGFQDRLSGIKDTLWVWVGDRVCISVWATELAF